MRAGPHRDAVQPLRDKVEPLIHIRHHHFGAAAMIMHGIQAARSDMVSGNPQQVLVTIKEKNAHGWQLGPCTTRLAAVRSQQENFKA